MVHEKVRIRFRKLGDLRLLSHHDLMRCFERMLRRAALPFRSTQGFNPKPRLIFAMPLPLGIVGHDEIVDLELDVGLPPQEVRERLDRQAPAGLEITSVQRIAAKSGAQVQRARYRIALPPERHLGLPERVAALLAAPDCWIVRQRPEQRRLDVRRFLADLRLLADALEIDLWVTPNGTARPDEVLEVLGLRDLLDAGAVFERTGLDLHEETTEPSPSAVPGGERDCLKGTA